MDELGLTTDSAGALLLGVMNLLINIYQHIEIGDLGDRVTALESGTTGTSSAVGSVFRIKYCNLKFMQKLSLQMNII